MVIGKMVTKLEKRRAAKAARYARKCARRYRRWTGIGYDIALRACFGIAWIDTEAGIIEVPIRRTIRL